ncbi:autotransporter outer membrane beta-barrel domain-containing protein [Aureimonas pseudogalii]|uniref:Autotransporter domain-containing protein n=1 Tax=Aureimonas pseudogalii TaxID=1744844 RepID=A0A7W6MKH8_9HYPH|nr:autotransporter outer membrane beta-barrel domain-containing protein [Aureimonas pseudogalii]MBB3999029.1 hypothetical protein [Aureimonas pseudogalii]
MSPPSRSHRLLRPRLRGRLVASLSLTLAAASPALGGVAENADLTATLASAVSSRLGDRLERLRDADRKEASGVELTLRLGTVETDAPVDPFLIDDPTPVLPQIYLQDDILTRGVPSRTMEIKRAAQAEGNLDLWWLGSVDLGRRGDGMLAPGRSAAGLSAGFDVKPEADRSYGLALGFDQGLGAAGSVAVPSLAAYGSVHPTTHTFVDAVAGLARVETALDPAPAEPALGLSGRTLSFGALTFGYEARKGRWLLSPYGRAELSAIGPFSAPTSVAVSARRLSAVAGLRADYTLRTEGLLIKPGLRFEMLRDLSRVDAASDRLAASSARTFSFSPGIRAELTPDWSARLEHKALWGGAGDTRSVELRIDGKF